LVKLDHAAAGADKVFYFNGIIISGVSDSMLTLTTRMGSLVASEPSASTQGRLLDQSEVQPISIVVIVEPLILGVARL
jgi:hypothetical protein